MDGHEREDVVKARDDFLLNLTRLGLLNSSNAPSEEQAAFLPNIDNSENTIFFFHDEPTFSANDDERTMWKDSTMQVLRPEMQA